RHRRERRRYVARVVEADLAVNAVVEGRAPASPRRCPRRTRGSSSLHFQLLLLLVTLYDVSRLLRHASSPLLRSFSNWSRDSWLLTVEMVGKLTVKVPPGSSPFQKAALTSFALLSKTMTRTVIRFITWLLRLTVAGYYIATCQAKSRV